MKLSRDRHRIRHRDLELAPRCPDTGLPGMTGRELRYLMRIHKCTIRELARRTGNHLHEIRQLRVLGLSFLGSLDYWQAVTGAPQLDARHSAQFRQWQALKASGQRVTSFAEQE